MQLFHLCLIISCSCPTVQASKLCLGWLWGMDIDPYKEFGASVELLFFCLLTSFLLFEISSTPPLLCIGRP
uniref:Truncated precore/core protein n=1 Tax=Hepatitis B virus TaxID=10407 RepID=D9U558_HBV|nr:truncated precore/core protein [Hepatitis B virus]